MAYTQLSIASIVPGPMIGREVLELWVCSLCAAVVTDTKTHTQHHQTPRIG